MPALCAERREPPTERICQPGRDRVIAIWAMMAITMATITAIENPYTVPSPMKSSTSEVISDCWIWVEYLMTSRSKTARPMISVTSVVRNARNRM